MEPDRQLCGAAVGVSLGLGVGPFAERGLDEPFGFSVGLRSVSLCPDQRWLTRAKPMRAMCHLRVYARGYVVIIVGVNPDVTLKT